MKKFPLLITLGLSFLTTNFASAQFRTFPGREFDNYAEQVLIEYVVPGLAVAIVKDGEVILSKGYGVRNIDESERVDDRTLFGIGSNTKAFTTAALAILVDEGKIAWDDAVIDHLPGFQMYDPYVTREMTVRDLLTHRSGLGLGEGDLLFWPKTDFTPRDIVNRLRFLRPASSFRSKYAYDNILYIVAGELIAAVTGKSWSNFVKERILTPLGMGLTKTSVNDFIANENIAEPHVRIQGKVRPVGYMNIENAAPAGALNSCVSDMAKWLIAQMDSGAVRHFSNGNERLFRPIQTREMWSAHTNIPIAEYPSFLAAIKPNFLAYGLGWMLADYRGHRLVYHTGVLLGQVSRVTLVPDLKLGIVVLTNQEARGAFQSSTYYILDHYFAVNHSDWLAKFKKAQRLREDRVARLEKKYRVMRVKGTEPSLEIKKYAGRYVDKWYGEMTIELVGNSLVMRFGHSPDLIGNLEHWHYNTFIVHWRDRSLKADAYVTFYLNHDGRIEQVKMLPVSPFTDFSFDFQDLLFKPVNVEKW